MASVMNGSLSLGLLVIPIKVEVAAREKHTSFNMLCPDCMSRINQKTVCNACHKDVDRGKTLKGYPAGKDKYLVFSKEELKAVEPESTKTIDLQKFVDADTVDAMLFESSYFIVPDAAGVRGYNLIRQAMEETNKYGIGKVTMSGREHVVIVRPYKGALSFHTMFYVDEVNAAPTITKTEVQSKELDLAKRLIEANAGYFDHAAYSDGYQQSLADLIFAKQAGQEFTSAVPKKEKNPTDDLMSALERSLHVVADNTTKPAAPKPSKTVTLPQKSAVKTRKTA